MCGIVCHVGKSPLSKDSISGTLTSMRSRGPDSSGSFQFKFYDKWVTLIHTRLSILDLDERSNQPFFKDSRCVVFNGEIYNFVEIRDDLRKKGYRFTTESDTEVILIAYEEYGTKCVDHFDGMWSFVIYDDSKKRIFISRDRFAEKPLYIYKDSDELILSSETRFIKEVTSKPLIKSKSQIRRYIANGHRSIFKHGETFYENVHDFPRATNAIVDRDLNLRFEKYWDLRYDPDLSLVREDIVEESRHLLIDAVKTRMRADVPLAFCLSGGVDSTSIISIAKKIHGRDVKTFSIIDSDGRYNELDNISAVKDDLGCDSHMIYLRKDPGNIDRLINLVRYHDSPIYTISYLVQSFLLEEISRQGYKVSISGTAADEIYSGYYDHFNLFFADEEIPDDFIRNEIRQWTEYIKPNIRNQNLIDENIFRVNPGFRNHLYLNSDIFSNFLTDYFKEDFIEGNYSSSNFRNRMMNELFVEVVRPILHEDDLNSMMHSVENRSPFLDLSLQSEI